MALGTTDKLLKFRVGNFTNLKDTEFAAGTVYVTQDEKALYIDLPTGTTKENGRIRLGGLVQYDSLENWNAEVAAQPPYSTEAIYYIVASNALIKWNGTKWVQINSTATVTENLDALTKRVASLETAKTEQAAKITNLETAVNTTIPATYATKAALKEATDDISEIVGQIGNSTNGLIKDIADNKKAIEDEAIARTNAINSVNNEISGIKNSYLTKADAQTTYQTIVLAATKTELANKATELLGTSGQDGNTIYGALKAVADEASRASGVESGLNTRLGKVEAFFELTEGEQLDEALDTLKEIQTYITSEGAAADKMVVDIATNKASIEALEGIVGKKAVGEEVATGLCKDVADNAAAIAQETANRNAALSWGTF